MNRAITLWKSMAIVFINSFCVMVIELIASRILAPYIGVSLYTWTSIIGVILAGIALGNYLGGKLADRYPYPLALVIIMLAGSWATIAIVPALGFVIARGWFNGLPLMANFILKTSLIFLLPAVILSMVSPLVIKLALAEIGQTGSIVGSVYACSTVGSILGTFMTGFYFILWFGTRMTVRLVAVALLLTAVLAWFLFKIPDRWRLSLRNIVIWAAVVLAIFTAIFSPLKAGSTASHTRESNYYTIGVWDEAGGIKVLALDCLVHSYVLPDDPTRLQYEYLKIFTEIVSYTAGENRVPRLLHLGGGGYSFPRFMETVYPGSINDVAEIDPLVTEVAHAELGLPLDTSVRTYNEDARLFLIEREGGYKYNYIIGDVFNDLATPYHLTTLEFDRLVKATLEDNGIYLVNIVDNYSEGRYMPSFVKTLEQVFRHVYLFGTSRNWDGVGRTTFVIAATDRAIDLADLRQFASSGGEIAYAYPHDEAKLEDYLKAREALILTDDYAPTDILMAYLFKSKIK
ncbi:MAG: fused MFS/spermidine synthase [Chloroflexota bacterium]